MLKTRICFSILIFACLLLPAAIAQQVHQGLSTASLELGSAVLRGVSKNTSAVVVASSLFDGLGMLIKGAGGETRKQLLEKVFKTKWVSTVQDYLIDQRHTISEYTDTKINYVDIATFAKGEELEIQIKGVSKGAIVDKVVTDNNTATTAQKLNGLVSYYTNGIIRDAFKPEKQHSPLLLTNAVHFKALWQYKFPTQFTTHKKEFFVQSDNCKVNGRNPTVTWMTSSAPFPLKKKVSYLLNTTCVRLPFGDSDNETSFYAFLPRHPSVTVDKLLSVLGSNWKRIVKDLAQPELDEYNDPWEYAISMPAFSIKSSISVKQTLQQLGVTNMFDSSKANFFNFRDQPGLFVRNIIHKAYLKINEQGAEGAGLTQMTMIDRITGIYFDKPFAYVIANTRNGDVYFVGRYMGPNC